MGARRRIGRTGSPEPICRRRVRWFWEVARPAALAALASAGWQFAFRERVLTGRLPDQYVPWRNTRFGIWQSRVRIPYVGCKPTPGGESLHHSACGWRAFPGRPGRVRRPVRESGQHTTLPGTRRKAPCGERIPPCSVWSSRAPRPACDAFGSPKVSTLKPERLPA